MNKINKKEESSKEIDLIAFFHENNKDYFTIEKIKENFDYSDELLKQLLRIAIGKKILRATTDNKYYFYGKTFSMEDIQQTIRNEEICAKILDYYLGSPLYLIIKGSLIISGGFKYPMGETAIIFELTNDTQEIVAYVSNNMRILKLTESKFSFIYYDHVDKPIKSNLHSVIF